MVFASLGIRLACHRDIDPHDTPLSTEHRTMPTTPEIEAILSQLTDLCCDALQDGGEFNDEQAERLTKNLATNGWKQHSKDGPPLSSILKDRVRTHCPEPAIHRGAAIDGIVANVHRLYERAARFNDSAPDKSPPKAMPPRTLG